MRSSVKAWFRLSAVAMTLALMIPVLSHGYRGTGRR